MRLRLQFAGWVLALAISGALAHPCVAQRAHYAAQQHTPKPASPQHQDRPAQRQQNQQQRQQQRQDARRQNSQSGQNGGAGRGQSNPDWNRPGGGTVHADRPPSANTPPSRYNNLSPQDKQRVLNNNRQWQNLSPTQRQQVQERAQIWQKMTPAQQAHIRNDVLPRWKQMPPDRKRAVQNRLGVLKNMPESARNQHLNDPNFTRGMSEEDKSTLRDLSHLHVGGAPDPQSE
jgi:hypothetical protein